MRKTFLALLLSGLLTPVVANAQPNGDGGVPLPDGGVTSGMDAGSRSSGMDAGKRSKNERQPDDSGSQGAPGGQKPGKRSHGTGGGPIANP